MFIEIGSSWTNFLHYSIIQIVTRSTIKLSKFILVNVYWGEALGISTTVYRELRWTKIVETFDEPERIECLQRTRLFRGRMIRLHTRPPPIRGLTGDTQEDWEKETRCWQKGGGEEGGRGAESYNRKQSQAIYKSFCILSGSVADPGCLSRIRLFPILDPTFFPSRIRIKEFKDFNPIKWFLSSR